MNIILSEPRYLNFQTEMLHICSDFTFFRCYVFIFLSFVFLVKIWIFDLDNLGFESSLCFTILIRIQQKYVQVTSFPINVTLQMKFRRQFLPLLELLWLQS